jgi:hypothetical protein
MMHLLFTCLRARKVWKELGLFDIVHEVVQTDYSGLVVLEKLICSKMKRCPVLGHMGLQEMIAVGCWYIWWQRRQFVNGLPVTKPSSSASAINVDIC